MRSWIYRWIDERGRIPWPLWMITTAHFCNEMDGLLCVPWDLSSESCCCGIIDNTELHRRMMNDLPENPF